MRIIRKYDVPRPYDVGDHVVRIRMPGDAEILCVRNAVENRAWGGPGEGVQVVLLFALVYTVSEDRLEDREFEIYAAEEPIPKYKYESVTNFCYIDTFMDNGVPMHMFERRTKEDLDT